MSDTDYMFYYTLFFTIFSFIDFDQHGLLCADSPRQIHPEAGVRGAACLRNTTLKGQVLEFYLLQIHLCIWRLERPVHERSPALGGMVHGAWLPESFQPTLQGPI